MEENEILVEKGLSLTYDDCETEFSAIMKYVRSMKETELYIEGDHWQSKDGWIGWRPESNSKSAMNKWTFIEQAFTWKNVIGGMVKRLKGAIAGQQPDFAIVPKDKETTTDAEMALYKQMDAALNDWFTQKDVHEQIKKFVHNRTAHGKGCLRIHIPIGLLEKDGDGILNVPAKDFRSALDYIYVTAHDYDKFTDGKDVNFGEKYTIVRLAGNVNPSDLNNATNMGRYAYEISFVDKKKRTVVRTVKQDTKEAKPFILDLGGQPLCLVKGDYTEAIISKSIKSMQRRVNCAKTNEGLAGDNINFPETTIIDGELPTEAVLQPSGKYKEQEVLPSGMGIWRKITSRLIQDADGGDRAVQAQIHERKQESPEHFARIASNNTRDMHQEAGMLYIYLADSEYASGDAKIEAMADYLILLVDSKTELDVVGTWVLNTVTRLAMRFANEEKLKEKFAATYSTKLTLGKLTVEERTLMLEEVKLLLRSPRSYQVVAGVSDDPEMETKTIEDWFNSLSDDMKQVVYGLMKQQQPTAPPKATGAGGS